MEKKMKVYEAIIESVLKPKKPIRVTWTKDKLLQVKKRLEEKINNPRLIINDAHLLNLKEDLKDIKEKLKNY